MSNVSCDLKPMQANHQQTADDDAYDDSDKGSESGGSDDESNSGEEVIGADIPTSAQSASTPHPGPGSVPASPPSQGKAVEVEVLSIGLTGIWDCEIL